MINSLAYLMTSPNSIARIGEGSARICADRVAVCVSSLVLLLFPFFALRGWGVSFLVILAWWATWLMSSLSAFFGQGSNKPESVFAFIVDLVMAGRDL